MDAVLLLSPQNQDDGLLSRLLGLLDVKTVPECVSEEIMWYSAWQCAIIMLDPGRVMH